MKSSLVIHATAAETGSPHITYACPISPRSILCFGPLDYTLSGDDIIACNGQVAQKPYMGMMLEDPGCRHMLLLLSLAKPVSSLKKGIAFTRGTQHTPWPLGENDSCDKNAAHAHKWAEGLSVVNRTRALWFLLRALLLKNVTSTPAFATLCSALYQRIPPHDIEVAGMRWLLPDMIGFEYRLHALQYQAMQLVAITPQHIETTPLLSRPLPHGVHDGCAVFATEMAPQPPLLALMSESHLHLIPAPPAAITTPMVHAKPQGPVLVVSHAHPADFAGGAEIASHRLFSALHKKTPALYLAATGENRQQLCVAGAADDEFYLHGAGFDYFLQSSRTHESLQQGFGEFLHTHQPRIVHFHHTLRIGLEAIAMVKSILPHTRILYTLHDFIPLCHRDGQMVKTGGALCSKAGPDACSQCFPALAPAHFAARERFIRCHFDMVDMFISPGHFLAERYRAWGIDKKRITIIPHGVEKSKTLRPLQKSLHTRFAWFGQITPYKGLELLLEAVHLLQRKGVECHIDIHGHFGMQSETFKARFHELLAACGNFVTFHGVYKQKDLPHLMARTGWVVMPSTWWENAPLVIDEALAHARPVICAGIGGMAEKITHGKNGLHFTRGDAQSLAAVMEQAAHSPALWRKLRAGIAPPASIEECANAHRKLYDSLIK